MSSRKAMLFRRIACLIVGIALVFGASLLGTFAFAAEDQAPEDAVVLDEAVEAEPADVPEAEPAGVPEAEPAFEPEGTVLADEPLATEEVEAHRPNAPSISAQIRVYTMNTSGDMTLVRTWNRSTTGGDVSVPSATSFRNYQGNVNVGSTTYVFQGWADADGNALEPGASFTYEQVEALAAASDDGVAYIDYIAQYEERVPIDVTVNLEDIRQNDGNITSSSTTNTLSYGSGWGFTRTRLERATGLSIGTVRSYAGYDYTYTGYWTDQDGNTIDASSTIWFYNRDDESSDNTYYLSEDAEFTFTPVWDARMIHGLDYYYVDNISTGSGSWSNASAYAYRSQFGSLTHTYTDPSEKTPRAHYQFMYWQGDHHTLVDADGTLISDTDDSSHIWKAGESMVYFVNSGDPEGSVVTYYVNAMWQPSVTVNYHYEDGTETTESFTGGIGAYDFVPGPNSAGDAFEGWYDAEGNRVDEETLYALPAITSEDGTATSYDIYARYYPAINIVTTGGEWVYDGTAHDATVEVTFEGDSEGYEVEATTSASLTNVGTLEAGYDTLTITITKDGEPVELSALRVNSEEYGTLVVTPRPVTVTIVGNTDTVTYDGDEHSVTGYTTTISDELFDESLIQYAGDATASGTEAGMYPMGLAVEDFSCTSSNFEVTFEVTDGELTVVPAPPAPAPEPQPEPEPEPEPAPEPKPAPKPSPVPKTGEPMSLAGLFAALGAGLVAIGRRREN